MLHERLPSFWCDISAYPGNSGGPIVEDDKLVGIVSSQAVWEDARIPFGMAIKTEHIRPLLADQSAKPALF